MDDCIKNMIFCMDLINYVAKKKNLDVKLGEDLKRLVKVSPYQDVIGEAVLIRSSNASKEISSAKESLNKPSLKEISQWAISQCAKHMKLEYGFSPDPFISYCVTVCSLMEDYSKTYGDRVVCEVLANAICNRLDGLALMGQFEEECWEDLVKAAKKIVGSTKSKK